VLEAIIEMYPCIDITSAEKMKGRYLSKQHESHVICSCLPLY